MQKELTLTELFGLQAQIDQALGLHWRRMAGADRQAWYLNYCRAMSQEITTLTESPPRFQPNETEHMAPILANLLHSLLSLALLLRLSPDALLAHFRSTPP